MIEKMPIYEKSTETVQEKIEAIMLRSDHFIVVSGPSGSGKTMAIKYLVEKYGFFEPPFLTTRLLRSAEGAMGEKSLSDDEFMKKEVAGEMFLVARNYGNAYGYDLDVVFAKVKDGGKIIVEAPASHLTTNIRYFLPNCTVIGLLPSTSEELEVRLENRGIHTEADKRIRLLNAEMEKECIVRASSAMDIARIIPTNGVPLDTLMQIDQLMLKKMFVPKASL